GRGTPALGNPGDRGGRGGAAPVGGAGRPGMGAPRGPGCDHAHAHGSCPWGGAPPGPASDAGVGHVGRPCLPGSPHPALDLAAALEAPPSRPGRQLLRLLRADGLLAPTTLGLGVCLAAGSVTVEALLWRGLVDLTRHLGSVEQRLGALGALLVFVSVLLL